jgi:hypothetical protein
VAASVAATQAPQRAALAEAQAAAQAIAVQAVLAQQGKVTTVQHLLIDQLTAPAAALAELH